MVDLRAEASAVVLGCWERLFASARDVGEEVLAAYGTPVRAYHNLGHIAQCLRLAGDVSKLLENTRAVEIALIFHDAVYDATRADNEERSAEMAIGILERLGQAAQLQTQVRNLILDTRHRATPATHDGRYVVDIDLAILGQASEVFDEYDRAIREEYQDVPEAAYRSGRVKILRGFLSHPQIYLTDWFRARYEAAARENLARVIGRLEGGV